MSHDKTPAFRRLTDQLIEAAKNLPDNDKRATLAPVMHQAEDLIGCLDPKQTYQWPTFVQTFSQQVVALNPVDELSRTMQKWAKTQKTDSELAGKVLRQDLRQFIEDLSERTNLTIDDVPEEVLSVEDVSEKFNVSTKTVNRWRDRGLVSRRFLIDGRRRVGFLQSSVERFVADNPEQVARGSRFSQLQDDEKDDILRRARRMAQVPSATLAEVSRRIANKLKRSPETVRYTIKNHDRENPDQAIFPHLRGPMDQKTKQSIFKSYRRGADIERLAESFNRTRSSVYRVVNEMRADRLLNREIDFIDSELFAQPDADELILGAEPEGAKNKPPRPPAGLPSYLQSLYEVPLFTKDQEQYLFRKMNYLLYKAHHLQQELIENKVRSQKLDQLEKWLDDADAVKRRLIRGNLRLVVSIAKRHVGSSHSLFELVSDGNVSLMRAVEKFDYSRGFKFSTYASWAIMKNFARSIPAENTRRDRFLTGQELAFDLAPDQRIDHFEVEMTHRHIRESLLRILNKLEDRERKIIVYRYGLNEKSEPQTLEQVGSHFGVTKERIRQIEARAINKLRKYASQDRLDLEFLH